MHFRSKALERTILKICVLGQLEVSRGGEASGYLLDVDAVAGAAEDETGSHGFCEASCLLHRQLSVMYPEIQSGHT